MPKSKNRKNHKAKVNARNKSINQQKKKAEKMQREFLMDLIKKEQEKGLFDNNPTIEPIETIDGSKEGPTI